jgi:oligogalacturonide lyase
MKSLCVFCSVIVLAVFHFSGGNLMAQIGTRFPSERKIVKDPVTGIDLVFLTSQPFNDRKIYQTHNQWTADGQWLVFSSNRVAGSHGGK